MPQVLMLFLSLIIACFSSLSAPADQSRRPRPPIPPAPEPVQPIPIRKWMDLELLGGNPADAPQLVRAPNNGGLWIFAVNDSGMILQKKLNASGAWLMSSFINPSKEMPNVVPSWNGTQTSFFQGSDGFLKHAYKNLTATQSQDPVFGRLTHQVSDVRQMLRVRSQVSAFFSNMIGYNGYALFGIGGIDNQLYATIKSGPSLDNFFGAMGNLDVTEELGGQAMEKTGPSCVLQHEDLGRWDQPFYICFVQGLDGRLYFREGQLSSGLGSKPWTLINIHMKGSPFAVRMGKGAGVAVAVRASNDSVTVIRRDDVDGWAGPFRRESVGGTIKYTPTIAVDDDGKLIVAVVGTDGKIYLAKEM